jgi:hypothetical protein
MQKIKLNKVISDIIFPTENLAVSSNLLERERVKPAKLLKKSFIPDDLYPE